MDEIKRLHVNCKLIGLAEIVMDKYVSMKGETPVEQKMYLNENNEVGFPGVNMMGFFCDTKGGAIYRYEGAGSKTIKEVIAYAKAHFQFNNFYPLSRVDKNIVFTKFDGNGEDKKASIYVRKDKATDPIKKSPIECVRPVIKLPWEVSFEMWMVENSEIDEQKLHNIIAKAGTLTGLGSYRPIHGKFALSNWEADWEIL